MKKTTFITKGMALLAIGIFIGAFQASATVKTYQVSANIPTASGATFAAYEVTGTGSVASNWRSLGTTTAMGFGTLKLNTATDGSGNQWFSSQFFFAIDVFPNGSGVLTHTFSYVDSTKPTGQTKGLGLKAVAKLVQQRDGQTETTINTKLLRDIGTVSVNGSTFTNQRHLRVYLSLFDGLANAGLASAGGEPFIPSDKPGSYAGTFTITAVTQ